MLLSGTDDNVAVTMQVDGINSPADYAALLSYLNALEGISSYKLNLADAESLVLQLETGGQLRQLVETIALEPALQEVAELSREGAVVSMHYRWVRD